MKRLSKMGQVIEVAHDHFFRMPAVAEMIQVADRLAKASADGSFSAAAFRDKVDNGRKVAIQVLEFFDRHSVTIRKGDIRKIRPDRLNLSDGRRQHKMTLEEKRPRWGGRTSNPVRVARRLFVGSTPTLFRHFSGEPR